MRRKTFYFMIVVLAVCARGAVGQDDGEMRIRRALEGRQVMAKMDLPAIDVGIPMIFDDTKVSFDETGYNKLVKEYGAAVKKGNKARITGVRLSNRGIEIDLDGGGSPGKDWLVGSVRLDQPAALARSDREIELERMLDNEKNMTTQAMLRQELDMERQARLSQDERNHEAFERVSRYRSEYLKENRKNWGTKLIVTIRSKKETTPMSDLVKSLAQYVELLPRETAVK